MIFTNEQSKSFIVANWFKLVIVVLAIVIISIYFYREYKLDECLNWTEKEYSKLWDEQCAIQKKNAGCELNSFDMSRNPKDIFSGILNGTAINAQRDKAINECYRRYSFK